MSDSTLSIAQIAAKAASDKIPTRPMTPADCSLWNDPRWSRARESMGKDAEDHYTTIGEQFNGSINYETGESNSIPIPALDSLAYTIVGVRSGLTKEDLSQDELKLMDQYMGEGWYERVLSGEADIVEKTVVKTH